MINVSHAAASTHSSRLSDLPSRVTAGDRNAAAAFLHANSDLIRRRMRHKLGRAMRRVFDSQDLMSTLARRLDHYVDAGRADVANEAQLWGLVLKIAEHAIIDKARMLDRMHRIEGPDSEFANRLRHTIHSGEGTNDDALDLLFARIFENLPDPIDREILTLWCNGRSLAEIADVLAATPELVRKRWQRIREKSMRLLDEGTQT
ncbi:MAG: sigma-70 family RNA polymerase sigma factor [Phycisphaeraceae bacterium]|nr:sigma-70 family RNA polymerase sigma factor [Phycisphaeraceae bacterium]MCW5753207.1 sigma-70 family RNA polymerase sigma factor [Phycisphaeraceae bacterium]